MAKEKKSIALVGLSTLENIGLKELLHQEWEGVINSFPSFETLPKDIEKYIAIIVSSDIFSENIDYFMPKRQKLLILSRGNSEHLNDTYKGYLNCNWDEVHIKEVISGLLGQTEDTLLNHGELSSREIEVLRLVASGKLNKEIADELCISVNTVITHRKNLTSKLGVRSASALTTYAIMNGIV